MNNTYECRIDGQVIKTVASSESKAKTNAYYRYRQMTKFTLEEVRYIPMVVKLIGN
jgi:hypothetical protein